MSDTGKIIALAKAVGARPDPDDVKQNVEDWLDEHPEATTTVQDGAITKAKLASALAEEIEGHDADITSIKSDVGAISDLIGKEEASEETYSGWAENAGSTSAFSNAPFVPYSGTFDYAGFLVTKMKITITRGGTLTIGVVKKDEPYYGRAVDMTKTTVKEVLNIQSTGDLLLEFTNPFAVEDDEYIFIGANTDTCAFKYGGASTEKGFFYQTQQTWSASTNSIGVSFYAEKETFPDNIRKAVNSVYNGKTLSILGDSISTFSGHIPEGNETYYPAGTVLAVTDTWWKKLADALGMTINVNNSWSGSRVTTTNGETSAGCMTRCQDLGTNPDVIIVWMGINDFNNEVGLGTYDGSTELPTATNTFREAYAVMLNKILTAYPTSEVWVCTLPQCERNGESGFPEINGNNVALIQFNRAIIELAEAFGVKVLNHNKSGLTYQNMPTYNPDNLHPNKYGHSLIANNDIREMDGTISKRYPIG